MAPDLDPHLDMVLPGRIARPAMAPADAAAVLRAVALYGWEIAQTFADELRRHRARSVILTNPDPFRLTILFTDQQRAADNGVWVLNEQAELERPDGEWVLHEPCAGDGPWKALAINYVMSRWHGSVAAVGGAT